LRIANCDLCILDEAFTQILLNNEKTNLCHKCYDMLKVHAYSKTKIFIGKD